MVTPALTWPSVYAKVINYGHVVRALHSPMSHNFLRYYPLSPHPPHLELKRSEIYSLPKATFRGRKIMIPRAIRHGQKIVIASSEESDYRDHILKLADNKVLGFDTEQNPTFFRGETPSWPCLVQLASERVCIMWRLGQDAVRSKRLPPLLQSILTSAKVLKVTVSLSLCVCMCVCVCACMCLCTCVCVQLWRWSFQCPNLPYNKPILKACLSHNTLQ